MRTVHKHCCTRPHYTIVPNCLYTSTCLGAVLHACSTLLDAAELQRFNIARVDDRLSQTTPLSELHPNVTGPGQQEVLVRYIPRLAYICV
jgi:hypothetical protein